LAPFLLISFFFVESIYTTAFLKDKLLFCFDFEKLTFTGRERATWCWTSVKKYSEL